MCRRHHFSIHELLHYFLCPNKLSHLSCIPWHNHTSSKFWFRTCLVFFGMYCHNPLLLPNGSNCSSTQTAEPTKYNDWHKPMNLSQISWNAAILSSKRRSVLVALSSDVITDKRRRTIIFSVTLGGVLLQVKSLPWKTFVSLSVLSPVSDCSTSVFSGCPWSPVSATSYRESISSSRYSSTTSSSSSEPFGAISSPLCLVSSLDDWSRNRQEILQGRSFLFRISVKDTIIVFYSTLSP